jgi:hypothetical protein
MNKDFILNEIRRTARENDAKPLGTQTFFHATGIKRSDWLGKYWVRWGDALKEAGLEANEFQSAYDIDYLCERYIELTRELGHIPVEAELRLKARSDKTFPSHSAFLQRLGTKNERLLLLAEFCESRQSHIDVAVMCRDAILSTKQKPERQDNSDAVAQDGYVYMIKSGQHYKIGYTNDFHRRGKEIAIELPERATTIHIISTDDPSGIEAYWHNRFKSRRGNGEWFVLTPADIKAFRRRKFM